MPGIDRDGVIVVVRPDHYVAHVLPLESTDELAVFFAGIFGAKRHAVVCAHGDEGPGHGETVGRARSMTAEL